MLGTFSFEPYFKSYLYFIVWSLEISEIAFRSLSPSSSLLPLFSAPPLCSAVAGDVAADRGLRGAWQERGRSSARGKGRRGARARRVEGHGKQEVACSPPEWWRRRSATAA